MDDPEEEEEEDKNGAAEREAARDTLADQNAKELDTSEATVKDKNKSYDNPKRWSILIRNPSPSILGVRDQADVLRRSPIVILFCGFSISGGTASIVLREDLIALPLHFVNVLGEDAAIVLCHPEVDKISLLFLFIWRKLVEPMPGVSVSCDHV